MAARPPDTGSQNQDLDSEKRWHEGRFYVDSGHWTSHPLFASRDRHWLHNDVQSIRFYSGLHRYTKHRPHGSASRTLLAPVGTGHDIVYLQGKCREIHGIDLSPLALAQCPRSIITREADILHSGYEDESFNLVVCTQFLHHVHSVGFEPFVREFHRVLRSGGTLAILEPSALFPFNWVTALARRVLGNVTGLVDGERPIQPQALTSTLVRAGFQDIRVRGLLFTHVRFPAFVQHLLDALDFPFRGLPLVRSMANSVGWYCTKPG